MSAWLDNLSEDWPSQSPSPSSSPSALNASTSSRQSFNSRIPRFTGSSKPNTTHGTERRRSALSERSFSFSNVQNLPEESRDPSKRRGKIRRSFSAESAQPAMVNGTVEKKALTPSPAKSRGLGSTPEWKRRLIHGERAYGEQKDLFSGAGIENIFQKPPTIRRDTAKGNRGLALLSRLDSIPSSPPAVPATTAISVRPGPEAEKKADLPPVPEHVHPSSANLTSKPRSIRTLSSTSRRPTNPSVLSDSLDSVLTLDGIPDLASLGNRRPSLLQPIAEGASATKCRSPSGETASDFSPVFISKHNTADGRVDYAALDLSKSELENRLQHLQLSESHELQKGSASNRKENEQEASRINSDDNSLARMQSEEFPDDLPAGTPDLIGIGEFVNVRRGGLATSGSFMRRPLSPSSFVHQSNMESNPSGSKCVAQDVTLAGANASRSPKTPKKRDPGLRQIEPIERSSTSPLKIFGEHDTFTATKLHRRISQLENTLHPDETDGDGSDKADVGIDARLGIQHLRISGHRKQPRPIRSTNVERVLSANSQFGTGELDDHSFPEDLVPAKDGDSQFSLPSRTPSPGIRPPGFQLPSKFRATSVSNVHDTFQHKPRSPMASTKTTLSIGKRSTRGTTSTKPSSNQSQTSIQPSASHVAEGKRPPSSPVKNPTPKRRRTYMTLDLQTTEEEVDITAAQKSHGRIQVAIGKKRKDARYGSTVNRADPDVLACRHILRPRNPTPSQRRQFEIEEEILDVTEAFISSSPRLEAIQEHLAHPVDGDETLEQEQARAVANEVAAFSEKVHNGMRDEGRKRSVTTQDFLDEAMKIMSFIRKRGRPGPGLNDLKESHLEHEGSLPEWDGHSPDSPTNLSFSRPPTREGRESGWRSPKANNIDPKVLNHLRRYKDGEDEDFIQSSIGSRLGREIDRAPSRIDAVESHPPGLHIINHSPYVASPTRGRIDSVATHEQVKSSGSNTTAPLTQSSQTTDSTLARTINSRRSETVATLAPEAVAHLIPEEVAGMSFDKEKGIWVKAKSPVRLKWPSRVEGPPTPSEDDPFDHIPDLTIDEAAEARHLRTPKTKANVEAHVRGTAESDDELNFQEEFVEHDFQENYEDRQETPDRMPKAQQQTPDLSHKSGPKKHSFTHHVSHDKLVGKAGKPDQTQGKASSSFESVEHEIKIHEGRHDLDEELAARTRKITLSVPASFMASVSMQEERNQDERAPEYAFPTGVARASSQQQPRSSSVLVYPPRQSQRSVPYLPTPNLPLAPLHENQELSFVQTGTRQRNVNFAVSLSTNGARNDHSALVDHSSSSPSRGDMTFYLSELSDFTVHQSDERELKSRAIVPRAGAKVLEDRYAWGNHVLVKALQDEVPEEPYWEDLRAVDLSKKGVTSLHLLDMLCERLETVDLSDNAIDQLGGAPSGIRCLDIRSNHLTSITWWGNLTNLQYLNVSDNRIDSFAGFRCLIHLRELEVGGNRISSLEGLGELDGLLKLGVRGNRLSSVDFRGMNLHRLTSLDLGGNKISCVYGLENLPELRELKLDGNCLKCFPNESSGICPSLEYLDLSNNQISTLEVASNFPNLREIYVDRNDVLSASGLTGMKQLQIVSLRSQGGSDMSNLLDPKLPDLESLSLSSTMLNFLSLSAPSFQVLRHLELSSCGLRSLPEDFAGQLCNLRTLNLNFNGLKDIRPLSGMRHLRTLLLAGNRLSRLRHTSTVLEQLLNLEALDLRDNQFTLGFYSKCDASTSQSLQLHKPLALPDTLGESTRFEALLPHLQSLPFSLPWTADKLSDEAYIERLDDDTRLRRRVYVMLIAERCRKLCALDGMGFRRGDGLVRDEVWSRLVELGVLRRKAG